MSGVLEAVVNISGSTSSECSLQTKKAAFFKKNLTGDALPLDGKLLPDLPEQKTADSFNGDDSGWRGGLSSNSMRSANLKSCEIAIPSPLELMPDLSTPNRALQRGALAGSISFCDLDAPRQRLEMTTRRLEWHSAAFVPSIGDLNMTPMTPMTPMSPFAPMTTKTLMVQPIPFR
jgi:hypothetical protein